MSNVYIMLSAIDDGEEASRIAGILVEERLVACVNVVSGLTSIYRWEGKLQREQEYLMILKTSEERLQEAQDRLAELHPYDVPEVVSLPVESGNEEYLRWVVEETR